MLKALAAGALAGLFVLSTAAMAADTQGAAVATGTQGAAATSNQGALAPGKAASVKDAQWVMVNGHWVWLVGAGLTIGGLAAVLSGSGNGSVSTTTTGAR